ncbi:MAG: hypothetical protein AAFR64_11565 [Pseudomonadota bacterium]
MSAELRDLRKDTPLQSGGASFAKADMDDSLWRSGHDYGFLGFEPDDLDLFGHIAAKGANGKNANGKGGSAKGAWQAALSNPPS